MAQTLSISQLSALIHSPRCHAVERQLAGRVELDCARLRPPSSRPVEKNTHTFLNCPCRSLIGPEWLCLRHVPTQITRARGNLSHRSPQEVNHIRSPEVHGWKGGFPEKNCAGWTKAALGNQEAPATGYGTHLESHRD